MCCFLLVVQYGYRADFSAAEVGNRTYTFRMSIGGPDTDAMGGVGRGGGGCRCNRLHNIYDIHERVLHVRVVGGGEGETRENES